jgi:NADH:ubiquinone oxidoreductase subunit 2 (subunit N)
MWSVAGPVPTILAVIGGVAGALYYLRPLPDLFAALRAAIRAPSPAPTFAATAVLLATAVVVLLGLAPGLAYFLAALSIG